MGRVSGILGNIFFLITHSAINFSYSIDSISLNIIIDLDSIKKSIIMKKIILVCLVLLNFNNKNIAQDCLSGFNLFDTQAQIDSFPFLFPNCTNIDGNLQLGEFGSDITNFDSLQQLTSVTGDLVIFYNQNISTLNGLHNLTEVGGKLNIVKNSITSLTGLEKLVTVGTDLIINDNDSLINLVGLDKISLIGDEMFIFENDNLENLHGLENLIATSGLRVHENKSLQNFEGLNNVTLIDGSFDIVSNDALINFEGLEKVDSITGNFLVQFCPILTKFTGLDNLKTIGNNFTIRANNALTSLEAFENLNHVQGPGINISNNNQLTTLSGIDNIDMADLTTVSNLFLENSNSLSYCSVTSICDYLFNGGVHFIEGNVFTCNSSGAILAQCNFTSVKNFENSPPVQISPNPTDGFIEIKNDSDTILNFQIFNSTGQSVYDGISQKHKILDLSFLPKGIYFFIIKNENQNFTKKIIKL